MTSRPCLDCGTPTQGTRCPTHERAAQRAHHNPEYDSPGYRRLRKSVMRQWLQEHGPLCPGWQRPPHQAYDLTVDHIIPVARGGQTARSNLQVLCSTCNSAKGDSMGRAA